MARLSDIIRSGEGALRQQPEEASEEHNSGQPQQQNPEADFRSLPRDQAPPQDKMRDFPILSQIYNEVGTVATVVDKIDQISAFIRTMSGGEPVLQRPTTSPPAQPSSEQPPTQPPPREVRPAQAPQAAPSTPPPQKPAAQPSPPPPEPIVQPLEATEEEVEAVYDELRTFVEGVMQAAQTGAPFSVDPAYALIARAVDLPRATDVLYRRAIYTRETDGQHEFASAVVIHSANVAIYALKIGEGLGYNRDQLIDLGVAALLHDVGMITLPDDFFSKGKLSDEDFKILHQHPIKARDILYTLGENYHWLGDVALQEHEREDGSGYPQGLKGNDIHQYAKVIGVADTYAGLTRSRPERRGLLPFEAVKEILQTHKPKFDSRVIRVLLGKLSAFPIGSLVQLNSGAIGTVVQTDEAYPLRPSIRILFDAQGRRVDDDRVINLREYPILHISDAIYEDDLAA
ncbi:MAG: HD domain-containing protein [bacterium]|nr:HD domain-containing protein [bacterium]